MNHTRQTTRVRATSLLGLLFAGTLGSVGCAGGHPPQRPAEVPVDNAPPTGTIVVAPGETTTSSEIPIAPVANPGGNMPTPVLVTPPTTEPPLPATVSPIATTAKKAPVPKAQRLNAADCIKLMDKYVGLIAIGQGVSPDQVKNVLPMMKQQVASDPNYQNAQTACIAENSKKQYACAMKTTTVDAWKACLE
jgi:hypothetical protein